MAVKMSVYQISTSQLVEDYLGFIMPYVEEYYDIDVRRLFRINNSYSDDYVLAFAAASADSVFNDSPYVSILVYGYVVQ